MTQPLSFTDRTRGLRLPEEVLGIAGYKEIMPEKEKI